MSSVALEDKSSNPPTTSGVIATAAHKETAERDACRTNEVKVKEHVLFLRWMNLLLKIPPRKCSS
jgi:hypothetical protein